MQFMQTAQAQEQGYKMESGESFIPPAQKKAIAAYVRDMAALYSYCFDQAMERVGDKVGDPTAVKDVATTLFLSAARRYNLQ